MWAARATTVLVRVLGPDRPSPRGAFGARGAVGVGGDSARPAPGGGRPGGRSGFGRCSMASRAEGGARAEGHAPGAGTDGEGRGTGGVDPEVAAFQAHQAGAARLPFAEEARSLVACSGGYGVLSTNGADGHPGGSVVGFAAGEDGLPVFSFSTLSAHTREVAADARVALTVLASGFQDAGDGRVTLAGEVVRLDEGSPEAAAAREAYLKAHPTAFWVDFGDFSWFRMRALKSVRLVGGFARAGSVSGDDYVSAQPDPVMPFSAPVCGHMNADHADANVAMVKAAVGLTVQTAQFVSIDRLGANVQVTRDGQSFKLRLPWPAPATDRKAVKDAIVAMTRAAAKPDA